MLLAIGCWGEQETRLGKSRAYRPPASPADALSASSEAFVFSAFALFKYIPQLPRRSADVLCLVGISPGLLFHCYLFRAKRQNALKPPGCQ